MTEASKDDAETSGRTGGGDSGGGAYPNPHSGKKPKQGGYMGHGGQTDIGYRGPQADEDKPGAGDNPNAATEED